MHSLINECRVAQSSTSRHSSPRPLSLDYCILLLFFSIFPWINKLHHSVIPRSRLRSGRDTFACPYKCLIKCDCGLSLFNYHVLVYVVVLIQYLSNSRDADTNDRENRVQDLSFIVISLPVADYVVPAHDSSIWTWRCATRWLPFLVYNSYPTTVTCCHATEVLNNVLITVCVGHIIAKQNSALALPRWTEIY